MDLGENLKKARKEAGVTQKELAKRLQVYQKDISRWENNELTPNAITFARICKELNASADQILELKWEYYEKMLFYEPQDKSLRLIVQKRAERMANKKGSRQLKHSDRIRLEALYWAGHRVIEIAEILHVHRSTIYNELKRGQYEHLNSDYTREMRYSPDIAQQKCEENLKVRGTQLKIGNDIRLANYIEDKIINEDYSPDAIIGELTEQGRWGEFQTRICTTTVYSYIDKGIFLKVTNKDLPVKKNKKRKYNKVKKQKRAEAGESIENRPEKINKREEFGHWEMDSILGKRGKSKNTLLTLTERKTRAEIIFKLPDHTAESVVAAVDRLEKRWGEMFKKVFKSITVDNGTEFAYCKELERSAIGEGKRTKLYYCHPYSSWERGTNEVTNRMVRRRVPKGINFDGRTEEEIQEVENWVNKYPRRIHGYRSAGQLFNEELKKIS